MTNVRMRRDVRDILEIKTCKGSKSKLQVKRVLRYSCLSYQ